MSLTFERKKELVDNLVLAPSWHLRFEDRGPGKLVVYTDLVPNSRSEAFEDGLVALTRREYMPEGIDETERTFLQWVLYEYLWLTVHEAVEWFRYADTKQPVFDAHDAETTATRLLPPRPGEEWWRPSNEGKDKPHPLPPDYWETAQ